MTLIAGFKKEKCTVLFGDILLSSPSPNPELILPTVGKISKKDISSVKYKPSSLCQKINLLGHQLAIAFSGDAFDAHFLLNAIIKDKLHEKISRYPTRDVCNAIMELYEAINNHKKLSIIGMCKDGKQTAIFGRQFRSIEKKFDPSFDFFAVAGSGFDKFSEFVLPNLPSVPPGANDDMYVILLALGFTTTLLAEELHTRDTLQNLFGAGYEIIHPLGRGFAKLDTVTYLFWRAVETKKNRWILRFPFLACNYSYYNDILIIRSVRMSSAKLGRIESDELHDVHPLYKTSKPEDLLDYTPKSLNTNYMCNTFAWQNYFGRAGYLSFVTHSKKKSPVVWKNEFRKDGSVEIEDEFLKDCIVKIKAKSKIS